jgi:hypothetical protein
MEQLTQEVTNTLRTISNRGLISDEADKVQLCDGSDPQAVKNYLRDLDLVRPDCREEVFKKTARGSLLREGLQWLAVHNFDLDIFRRHVLQVFVSQDAEGVRRKELQQVSRQPGETLLSFNRRFRELAEDAFPLPHTPDQVETIVRLYAAGLKDKSLARRIITPAWPISLNEALTRVADTERQKDSLARLGYNDEAMEVDALSPRSEQAVKSPSTSTDARLHHIETQYGKLERKIDRLLASAATPVTSNRSNGPQQSRPSRPTFETRTCYYCGKAGHLKNQCRRRMREQGGGRPVAAASGGQQ